MKGIRFKQDCRTWIALGKKTTTFRKTRRNGLYELIEGSWYKPKPLGIYFEMKPLAKITKEELIEKWYSTEGDFDSPEEFIEWLKQNKLYKKLPEEGWLNLVKIEGT